MGSMKGSVRVEDTKDADVRKDSFLFEISSTEVAFGNYDQNEFQNITHFTMNWERIQLHKSPLTPRAGLVSWKAGVGECLLWFQGVLRNMFQ